MTVTLQYNLKSRSLVPPVLFFFLQTALAIWGFMCFHGSAGKESVRCVGDLGSILGWEIPWRGNGYPLQNSCLENSIDYSPWGFNELDMTEQLSLSQKF